MRGKLLYQTDARPCGTVRTEYVLLLFAQLVYHAYLCLSIVFRKFFVLRNNFNLNAFYLRSSLIFTGQNYIADNEAFRANTRKASEYLCFCFLRIRFSDIGSLYLSACCLGKLLYKLNNAGIFIRCSYLLNVCLKLLFKLI